MTIPTLLTLLRIVLIPFFILFFYLPLHWGHWIAALIFTFAAITDWLDGYLARALKQTSALGEFLDPVADKLIVAFALVLIVGQPYLHYLAIPAGIIVCREIAISALREWMAELGKRASVAVSYIGKIKTALQMVAIIVLLAYRPGPDHILLYVGYVFIYLAAIATLWTMVMYLRAAWPQLKNSIHAQTDETSSHTNT